MTETAAGLLGAVTLRPNAQIEYTDKHSITLPNVYVPSRHGNWLT